nr:Chain D, 2-acetamido-2-deoxy-alpha-D-glucopyranose-(1-35)-[2-acetamido-2-deoxy-alpha-D-galactopyranose-(1-65)]5,6-DIHYDRO-BENZO[H]CINNOLIN-3-YLAMINE [synthetic construct]7EC3_G Chain G, 2-acetamido-2-deoxy-alpha-D-glucopyranose-(1-35)-[2-acetamido-2-deoxy-alpha-D-galactopyranose-(1-65)]5,6-DIHYDRO-BENZO[H]CINNOLIN-3-YLAMINE [synthetic construct]
SDSDSDSD